MQTGGHLALYPGTFDPVHHGHQDIVARAARLLDRVCVGVVGRPSKPFLFEQDERVELFRRAVADIKNVNVEGNSASGARSATVRSKPLRRALA
jgi:pantetheine-phosphate adenylyltransferase